MMAPSLLFADFMIDSSARAFSFTTNCRTTNLMHHEKSRHRNLSLRSRSCYLSPLSATQGPINEDIFNIIPPVRIEGNSLKTWTFPSGTSKRAQVSIMSTGRPIEASVELWQTPSYTPTKFKVECEDGSENIVHSIIELPEGYPVTLAVYNTEGQEFPMDCSVMDVTGEGGGESAVSYFQAGQIMPHYVEGNKAVKSFSFAHDVEEVEVLLTTHSRNMKGE